MKRPSPLVLIVVLLIAALRLVDNVLIKCTLYGGLIVVGYMVATRLSTRARHAFGWKRIAIIGALTGILAIVAFCAMIGTQPRLRTTYRPDQFSMATDIVEQRGFYQTETDPAQNQYVWTQDRATIVFDFLVHKPITLTVAIRSAAVAGGPDLPVQVVVDGQEVGTLHPDPTNPLFQPLSLTFVPYNWGGERTEIKLVPAATFKPKGDSRMLGTMVQSITIDKSDAWSTMVRWMWLVWALPVSALAMAGLAWAAQRSQSSAADYASRGLSLLGGGCAALIGILILRIGFIERDTYQVWIVGSVYLMLYFLGAAILRPFEAAEATRLFSRSRSLIARYQTAMRIKTRMAAFTRPMISESAPARSAIRRDLVLVFALALGVRLLWVTITPPWEAPDEPDHYTYTAHIVEQAEIPRPPYPPYPEYPAEFSLSAGQTFLSQIAVAGGGRAPTLPDFPVSHDYALVRSFTGSHAERLSAAGANATTYPPLYYLFTAIPYKLFQHAPILARLFAVRCGSAILGALTCVFGYLMAYELRRERRWGWALALSLAFLPMFVFITATVNNDAAMDLGATALIWLLVRLYRQETITPPIAVVVGLVSGLTLLAKPGPLPVVVVVGIFMLVRLFPLLRGPLRFSRRRLAALGGYVAGGLIGYGPWVLFRLTYYGDFSPGLGFVAPIFRTLTGMTPVAAASAGPPPLAITYPLSAYLQFERHLPPEYFRGLFIKSVWGNFGWLDTPMPESAFTVVTVICAIGIVGLIVQLGLQSRRRPILLILLAFVGAQVAFLFLFVDYYASYRAFGRPLGLQGRYFFPVLAPALFLLLSGWDHLFRERPIALRLAPFVMVGLQLIGVATVLARYYGVVIGWS